VNEINYSMLLRKAISKSDLSLSQISRRLEVEGINATKTYLSKLQSGKKPPASDKLNDALALVLGIDPLTLRVSAYKEKIPQEVIEHLRNESA
jgi:transcriptional regulator with XRE-family HTH domain